MKLYSSERSSEPMSLEDMQEWNEKKNPLRSPNQDYLYMTCVRETKTGIGNNKYYEMRANKDGTFTATYGRIDDQSGRWPARSFDWPMDMWETKYYEKCQLHGYLLVREKEIENKKVKCVRREHNHYSPIPDKSVADIFERLKSLAKGVVKRNYTISALQVDEAQIERAEKLIVELDTLTKVDEFNELLLELLSVIPRRINNLNSYLAKRPAEFKRILDRETDLLDVMKGQVQSYKKKAEQEKQDSSFEKNELEVLGLEWREVTAQEMGEIKAHMGADAARVVNAWRVINKEQEKKYRKFCLDNNIRTKQQKFLFHGSRSENFYSIITNSLKINITGVVKTGSMYGNGLYFAPKAKKSIGYTSILGAHWTNGRSNNAFLSIWKVAVGETFDTYSWNASYGQLNFDKLQRLKRGANSLWAHGGTGCATRNDEVIIYKEEQCTLRYLVEIQ